MTPLERVARRIIDEEDKRHAFSVNIFVAGMITGCVLSVVLYAVFRAMGMLP